MLFIINCKNYEEIAGKKITKFIGIVEQIAKKHKIKIAVAPPQHLLSQTTGTSVPILAQHLDNSNIGSTTGFMIPELVKKSKVCGALINHSEHRIPSKDIAKMVQRLRNLNMISVVCVKDIAELKKYLNLNPDYIAIEPPELIGSGKAVSKERPDLIINAAKAVNNKKNKTKLLCGAGIVSGKDVEKAIQLGSKGILVASGIIKANNWKQKLNEFAKAML